MISGWAPSCQGERLHIPASLAARYSHVTRSWLRRSEGMWDGQLLCCVLKRRRGGECPFPPLSSTLFPGMWLYPGMWLFPGMWQTYRPCGWRVLLGEDGRQDGKGLNAWLTVCSRVPEGPWTIYLGTQKSERNFCLLNLNLCYLQPGLSHS